MQRPEAGCALNKGGGARPPIILTTSESYSSSIRARSSSDDTLRMQTSPGSWYFIVGNAAGGTPPVSLLCSSRKLMDRGRETSLLSGGLLRVQKGWARAGFQGERHQGYLAGNNSARAAIDSLHNPMPSVSHLDPPLAE